MGAKRKAKKEFAKEQELAKLRAKEAQKAAAKEAARKRSAARANAVAAERQRRLSAMTPAQRASYEKRQTVLGLVVMAVIVLGIGGCIVAAVTSDGGDESEVATEAGGDDGGDESDDLPDDDTQQVSAFEVCKDFVKDNLKSPGSASFRNYFEDDGEVTVSGTGDGPFTVVSTVDAENSFGAELRIPFRCEVRYVGDDEWRLVDLQLDE